MSLLTTRMRLSLSLALVSLIIGVAPRAFAQAADPVRVDVQPERQPDLDVSIRQTLSVARYTLQDLALPPEGRQEFGVVVALDGVDYTLILKPHSIRAPDFTVYVQGVDGTLRTVQPPVETTYRGEVFGVPGSVVVASLKGGRLNATVTLPDQVSPTWAIQPLSDIAADAPPASHVIYNATEMVPGNWRCGVIDQLVPVNDPDPGSGAGIDGHNAELLVCEVAFDADFEYYQINESSVGVTVTDINEVMNFCSAIYESNCWVQLVVTSVLVRESEPDPYTRDDPFELMEEFQNEWINNQTNVPRDIAHLFTGKNIAAASGIIGLGFIDVICSRGNGYALSQSRFTINILARIILTSHEIGHNFNAMHCNQDPNICAPCGIMCSGLGGCIGDPMIFGCSAGVIFDTALAAPCVPGERLGPTWILQYGTIGNEEARALGIDPQGDILIAGSTRGDLAAQNVGITDIFVSRYDPVTGQLVNTQIGSRRADQAFAAVPDGMGGMLIAGSSQGNLSGRNAGIEDAVVARFGSANQLLWVVQVGTTETDEGRAVAPDGVGGVFLAGFTGGELAAQNAGSTDAILARFDRDGLLVWITQFGSSGGDMALALESDGAGGVLVAGTTTGDLGGPNAGGIDAFLARYDGEGNRLWIRQFGTVGGDEAVALAPDGAGGVLVAGTTTGDLGEVNAGGTDAFVANYDIDGTQLSIFQFGTIHDDTAVGAVSDGAGGIVVAGHTRGGMNRPNLGLTDCYVARYSDTGELLLIMTFGTPNNDTAFAMEVDSVGGVLVVGRTDGSLGAANAGGGDVFLAYLEGFVDLPCYADCDPSTGMGVLDLFDFLCFQDSFVNGEAYACDCDTSTGMGVCDLFDFLCFQNAFVGGCN